MTTSLAPAPMPVVFLPHGGGPWPFVELGLGSPDELSALRVYLESLAGLPPRRPRALLVISAHWEASVPTVMTSPAPPMLFDYYGFPPESYRLSWPAPGDPALASQVRGLLEARGFETAEDAARGFDHGTFVPLMLTYPAADIPVVQLSLVKGLDPALHLEMGRALAPLRDQGVFIIASGMSYHNLRAFHPSAASAAEAFDGWLGGAMALGQEARAQALTHWTEAPAARAVHPREEHLIPLMVATGAAEGDAAHRPYNGTVKGLRLSAFHFGG